MGASSSSSKGGSSISLEVVKRRSKKQNGGGGDVSRKRCLRNSKHRPVLQLQVKPETLERMRRSRVGSASSGSISKNMYTSVQSKTSGGYENIHPRVRTASNGSRSSDHAHHRRTLSTGSRDSMVLLHIKEDEHGLVGLQKNDNYDHLISKKDFSHLCECTYGRVNVQLGANGQEAWPKGEGQVAGGCKLEDDTEPHKADIIYCHGVNGCSHHGLQHSQLILRPPSLLLDVDEMKRRIQYHQEDTPTRLTPPPYVNVRTLSPLSGSQSYEKSSSLRKSKSTNELLDHCVANDNYTPYQGFLTMSQSSMDGWKDDDDEEGAGDWTLGESIMRTLSRRDLLVVDIENPQNQSEFEIMAAWPRLKDEFKKKSQSVGNIATASGNH